MQRLLPKHEVLRRRAEEEQQRMNEGLRIAQHVDTLRETFASEEQAFEQYRINTLKTTQDEVQKIQEEKETLLGEISELKKQRAAYMEPLDRQFALYVKTERQEIENIKADLASKQLSLEGSQKLLTEQSEKLSEEGKELSKSRRAVEKEKEWITAIKAQAKKELASAEDTAKKLLAESEKSLAHAKIQERNNDILKENLVVREELLKKREEELEERETQVLMKELLYYSPVKNN